jgi:hypothetical protein
MEEKEKYLFLEYSLTFLLFYSAVVLIGEVLTIDWLYLPFGLMVGFYFSWFNRNKDSRLIDVLITICVIGVVFWVIYSFLNSSLFHEEVNLILIKAGIIVTIFIGFNSSTATTLSCIQILSLALFMCFPIFIREYNKIIFALILFYLGLWGTILRVKFYEFFKPVKKKNRGKFYFSLFLIPYFLIIVFISWIMFSRVSLGETRKGGFLYENKDIVTTTDALEEEYYYSQDKIQELVLRLITHYNLEDSKNLIYLLSLLIKESSIIMEVDKANMGLVDYLKRPGPGLEPGEGEQVTILLKNYVQKKASLNLQRAAEDIKKSLKNNYATIKERFDISNRLKDINYSTSRQQIDYNENEAQGAVADSLINDKGKQDLREAIKRFGEWKILQLYYQKMEYLKKKIELQEKQFKTEMEDLYSKIEAIKDSQDLERLKKELQRLLETYTVQLNSELMNEIKEILILKLDIMRPNGEIELNFKREIKAKELLTEITHIIYAKEEEKRAAEAILKEEEKRATKDSILLIIKGVPFLILGLIIVFIISFLLTEREKNKLRLYFKTNPRGFIICLYDNTKKILANFGLRSENFTPPLSFAELVEDRYSMKDNFFSKFTKKFEEAKYSKHILESKDCSLVLNDYNDFLKILFSGYNKFFLFLKYLILILQRTPLII